MTAGNSLSRLPPPKKPVVQDYLNYYEDCLRLNWLLFLPQLLRVHSIFPPFPEMEPPSHLIALKHNETHKA